MGLLETIVVSNSISNFSSPKDAGNALYTSTLINDFLHNLIKVEVGF